MLPLLALLATSPAHGNSGIAWIQDDWSRAKKTALAKKQMVAVDVWATWCHTCLSMTNYVLNEAPVVALKDRMTWLAMNFDEPRNGPFFEAFPPGGGIPTYFVVDPATEKVVARWTGSGTSQEMAAFFSEAAKNDGDSLHRGQLALQSKSYDQAHKIFQEALKNEKLDPKTKSRIVNGLVESLYRTDPKACAREVTPYLDAVEDSAQGLDSVAMVADCASAITDKTERDAILAKVGARLQKGVRDDNPLLAVDDCAAYLATMVDLYDELGDKARAEATVGRWVTMLESAAKAAKTPEARATFEYHRVEAYLRLGRYDDAITMLTASEKAQPKDFNHPWRLAMVYLKKGELDRGLTSIDRALKLGYGGRKVRLFSTKIDLLLAKKDVARAKATIEAARAHLKHINPSQVREPWIAELEGKAKQVEALDQKS